MNNNRPSIRVPIEKPVKPDVEKSESTGAEDVNKKLDHLLDAVSRLATRQHTFEKRLDGRPELQTKRIDPRSVPARVEIAGRGGELLSRRHDDVTNQYELPPEFIEMTNAEGYDLEWKTEFVYGQERVTYQAKLHANGWRPVLNNRLPGLFAAEGETGPIRHEGMILMERPMPLTKEARAEEASKATDQIRIKHQSWGVETKDKSIFDPGTPMARSHTIQPRSSFEAADPAWQPKLDVAIEGE